MFSMILRIIMFAVIVCVLIFVWRRDEKPYSPNPRDRILIIMFFLIMGISVGVAGLDLLQNPDDLWRDITTILFFHGIGGLIIGLIVAFYDHIIKDRR